MRRDILGLPRTKPDAARNAVSIDQPAQESSDQSIAETISDTRSVPASVIVAARDLRDSIAEHSRLRELLDEAIRREDPSSLDETTRKVNDLRELLDEHRGEPALQAALICEAFRSGKRKHGDWTQAEIARSYGVTADQLGRRTTRARQLLDSARLDSA